MRIDVKEAEDILAFMGFIDPIDTKDLIKLLKLWETITV